MNFIEITQVETGSKISISKDSIMTYHSCIIFFGATVIALKGNEIILRAAVSYDEFTKLLHPFASHPFKPWQTYPYVTLTLLASLTIMALALSFVLGG